MIKAETYAKALFAAVIETAPKDHEKVLDNFVKILKDNGDLEIYDQIEQEYLKLERQEKGIKEAEITTAGDVQIKKELLEYLNEYAGKKVEIKNKIDQSLIGGVVIRVDDTLMDASIKNSLNNLKETITKS